jgi:hypothetical protein
MGWVGLNSRKEPPSRGCHCYDASGVNKCKSTTECTVGVLYSGHRSSLLHYFLSSVLTVLSARLREKAGGVRGVQLMLV